MTNSEAQTLTPRKGILRVAGFGQAIYTFTWTDGQVFTFISRETRDFALALVQISGVIPVGLRALRPGNSFIAEIEYED